MKSCFTGSSRLLLGTLATGVVLGLLATLSPEIEVAPSRFGLNPTSHFGATVAVNHAGQYLVAYEDRRGDDSGWSNGDNLRLVRIGADGTLLDRGGIEPALSGPERQSFAVGSDGQSYLVAWSETKDTNQSDLRFLLLGADGGIQLAPAALRSAPQTEHYTPSVCFDGSAYRVVFVAEDRSSGVFTLYAARLSPSGALMGALTPLPTSAGSFARQPAVACAAGGSVVLWLESTASASSVRGVSWLSDGTLGGVADVSLPGVTALQSVAVAAGAGGYLAIWEEARSGSSSYALVGQLLSTSGARTSASDLALDGAAAAMRTPRLQFDGSAWRLLTRQTAGNQDQTFVTTIGPGGTITAPASALTAGPGANRPTDLACRSGGCFVLWSSTTTNVDYTVQATRLGATNTPLDSPPLPVSTPSDEQSEVQLAWDGAQVLVAWQSAQAHDPPQLLVRRLDGAGAWIDAAPMVVASGLSIGRFLAAAQPSGGFALIYQQPNAMQAFHSDVVAAFVSRSGGVTTAPALVHNTTSYPSSLSCIGSDCVLVLATGTAESAYRFDSSGRLLNMQSMAAPCASPFVVGQERWCVAKPTSNATSIQIRRYDLHLVELGMPLEIMTPNEILSQGVALMAGAGGVTLVWDVTHTDPTTMAASVRMKAARVDSMAQRIVSGPVDLFTSVNAGFLMPQALVDTGSASWLVWYANDGAGFQYMLRAQELTPALTIAGSVDELSSCGVSLVGASAVPTSSGNIALAYRKRDSAPDRGSHRVELRLSTGQPAQPDGGSSGAGDGGVSGVGDGGVSGAGDGGTRADGGANPDGSVTGGTSIDAGPADDGGVSGPARPASGCACQLETGSASPSVWCVLLLSVALVLRRRRARKSNGVDPSI